MAQSRTTAHLDDLEERLTGAKRIALFGHRDVGKTTLLAMFYRQASTGQVPGLRLAAGDAASAEYLAEKIAQIESGEPPAGTLAETALRLRLYSGPARFDLVVKDYQGEHVTLGAEEPIQAFFADCDAVLLCLDPEGSTAPAERRRRQQEVENLLERYIDRSADGTAGRPVALLLTKFDRVLDRAQSRVAAGGQGGDEFADSDDPAGWDVERFVERHYGMTRHALARHAPRGAIFAVSSFGRGAHDGRPPAELHPLGLEGPLGWLAGELETSDAEQLEWLWDLAPHDLPRLARCLAAYEKRYPQSDRAAAFRGRLDRLKKSKRRSGLARAAVVIVAAVAATAGYDAWGYQRALAFEGQSENAAPAVARRWGEVMAWHPSLSLFWPGRAKSARLRLAEWTVKAAEVQVANGTDAADLAEKLTGLKDQAPALAPAIRKVEDARRRAKLEDRWRTVRAGAVSPGDDPDAPLAELRAFLKDDPDSPHRAEALALVEGLKAEAATKRSARERRFVDELARAETLPNADLRDLIDRARQFLDDHPQSDWRPDVENALDRYVTTQDERDIERARQYSKQYPTNFATRIERYQDYLRARPTGGRFVSEATEAKDKVLREWDVYTYRLAYDHLVAHPDDVAEVARRLRDYLHDHRDGRYARDAQAYLAWWDKVSVPGDYRVTLRRGEVEPGVGKYLGGGGPDLGVRVEVAGAVYGPTPVVPNSRRPIWDYTFPRPVRWKLGDPVTVTITDHDWSDSIVYVFTTRKGDPLAIRNLSGTIRGAKGGRTTLTFASDFRMPSLSRPDE